MDAREIYQSNLDIVTDAVWAGDYETALAVMFLPGRIDTLNQGVMVFSREALVEHFDQFRANARDKGASGYVRVCREAEFTDDARTRIRGVHETFIMAETRFVVEPYRNGMDLRLDNGVWKCAGLTSEVSNEDCPLISPSMIARASRETINNTDRDQSPGNETTE